MNLADVFFLRCFSEARKKHFRRNLRKCLRMRPIVPKALEPWTIINSQGNGPYAVKTSLGWTVNGPLTKGTVKFVTANRIEELLQQQLKHDFPERQHEERLEMSQEDHEFMKKVSNSVKLKEGHTALVCLWEKTTLSSQTTAVWLSKEP